MDLRLQGLDIERVARRTSIVTSELTWFGDAKKEVHSGLGMFFNPKAWDSIEYALTGSVSCFDSDGWSGRASRP